jgi:hypothetical protein
MAGEIGTAYVAVKLDPTGIRQGLATTEAEATKRSGLAGEKAGKAFSRGMKAGMIGLAAIAVGAKVAVDAASDLNEEVNKTQVVFGKSAKSILAWSKGSAKAIGLSQQEALSAAGAYGNMFKTIGFGNTDAAKMSERMTQLAGDMASFHNQDPTDMLDKLRSGLSGEAEPLRRFGILLSENAVKQEAYRSGIAKSGKQLTEAQKVQARYRLIMEQSDKAQGDFARTSGGLANKQRIARAQFKDLQAQLGTALLPVVTDAVGLFSELAGWMSKNTTATKIIIGVIATLSATLVAANVAWKIYTAATTEGTLANYAFSVAARVLTASLLGIPVFAIAAALIALGAAFVIAYKKSATFRAIVQGALHAVITAAQAVLGFFRENWQNIIVTLVAGPFGLAVKLIHDHWDDILRFLRGLPAKVLQIGKDIGQALVDGITSALHGLADKIGSFIPDVPGVDLPGPLSAPAPAGRSGAVVRGPMEQATGLGAPSALGAAGGGLAGPVPIGQALRLSLARLQPTEVQAAPARVALTITNWDDGTGYMERVSDGSVANAAALGRQIGRMRRQR